MQVKSGTTRQFVLEKKGKSLPLCEQIRNQLRQKIDSEVLDPGRSLPPISVLMKEYQVNYRAVRLASYIDSRSPAFFDGGNFRLSASTDDKQWTILLEGRGSFAWRDVDLTPYAGREVFVRFDNPRDKGEARIRQMRLTVLPR